MLYNPREKVRNPGAHTRAVVHLASESPSVTPMC